MKKITLLFLSVVLSFSLLLSGCGVNERSANAELPYYDQISENGDYNRNIFYRNDLDTITADPTVVYAYEGEGAGYFYMYGTSDMIGCSGFQVWRSKDLNSWDCTGVAYEPDRDSWALRDYWAPEVVYSPTEKLYYLYYSATYRESKDKLFYMGVAVSANPEGPFLPCLSPTGDLNGRVVGIGDPTIDFSGTDIGTISGIDANAFIDDDGSIYFYFCLNFMAGHPYSEIYGMKMKNMYTPDYSTLTQITKYAKTKVADGAEFKYDGGSVNEGPFMLKHEGRYYLTYSTYAFPNREYRVCLAISDDPLKSFEKKGMILGIDPLSNQMSGTGHHSFVKAGDEIFAVYHAHIDREFGNSLRAAATDKAMFVYDEALGYDTLHINGPSYSIMPLPQIYSGYTNLAKGATITVTNGEDGSKKEFLNDGLITMHEQDSDKEFKSKAGTTKITIKFEKAVSTKAVMIYNSAKFGDIFDKQTKNAIINIDFKVTPNSIKEFEGLNFDNIMKIRNLKYDSDRYVSYEEDMEFVSPGSSAIAEYGELSTEEITITIKADKPFNISEIIILGKMA